MPNITKLKLQDDIEYTLSAPILLDQEESTSTTSAPSSNYLKTVVDGISSNVFNINEDLQQQIDELSASIESINNIIIDELSASIESINNIINTRLLQVLRLNDGTDLNTVTEVGQYTVNNPANFIPNYGGWACLYVTCYDNNPKYPMQIAIMEAGVYTRACFDGVWRYWCKLDRTPITE